MPIRSLVVGLLIVLVGCGTPTKQIMDSWKGRHVSRLIRSWGPPKQVVPDGAGGKIYIYSDRLYLPLADGKTETNATMFHGQYMSTLKSTTTYTPPLVLDGEKVRMFYANSDGVIYYWRAKGFINDPDEDAILIGILVVVGVVALIVNYLEYKEEQEFYDRLFSDY